MNNNEGKHALWLPENSIQAILAIILVVSTVVAVFKGVPEGVLTVISGMGSFALGHYFGKRAGESHPQE